ncbi:hypothetical protein NSS79_08055 [Paenibacillus sp. FSL L8-0436]
MNTGRRLCEYYAVVALQAGAGKGSEEDEGGWEQVRGQPAGLLR